MECCALLQIRRLVIRMAAANIRNIKNHLNRQMLRSGIQVI